MTTYVIGDVQGCYASLCTLLEKIRFNPSQDKIWFTGDLVNRGPDSLSVLQLVYDNQDCMLTVLGNHDLTLLAVGAGVLPFNPSKHNFEAILTHPQADTYLNWLRHCPFVHFEKQHLLVHAGFIPAWDCETILSLAKALETDLQSKDYKAVLASFYITHKTLSWSPDLTWPEKRCFLANAFTRLRFCTPDGTLDLETKEGTDKAKPGYKPWFACYPKAKDICILFGHWSALDGKTGQEKVIALDTGCVWGRSLTAYALETKQGFSVNCVRP